MYTFNLTYSVENDLTLKEIQRLLDINPNNNLNISNFEKVEGYVEPTDVLKIEKNKRKINCFYSFLPTSIVPKVSESQLERLLSPRTTFESWVSCGCRRCNLRQGMFQGVRPGSHVFLGISCYACSPLI